MYNVKNLETTLTIAIENHDNTQIENNPYNTA